MLMIGGVIGAVVIIGGAVLLMSSKSSSTAPSPVANATVTATVQPVSATVSPIATSSATPAGTAKATTVKTITLEGKNYKFTPKDIKVKKGEKVKVALKVMDMQHDFVIDELNVKSKIGKAGETVEVEFTPNKAGEFEFYCSVGNHRAQGMSGTIIVEE